MVCIHIVWLRALLISSLIHVRGEHTMNNGIPSLPTVSVGRDLLQKTAHNRPNYDAEDRDFVLHPGQNINIKLHLFNDIACVLGFSIVKRWSKTEDREPALS